MAEMKADRKNIRTGISTVCLPTRATTFLENSSSVPLAEAIPNKKVTPTSVTNMELLKPPAISLALMPPQVPRINATPKDRKPRFTFLMKPMATTTTNTIRLITEKAIFSFLLNVGNSVQQEISGTEAEGVKNYRGNTVFFKIHAAFQNTAGMSDTDELGIGVG